MLEIYRLPILFIFLTVLSGCSWVTRDYIYAPSEPTEWEYYYVPGEQKSVKDVPIPDKAILIFNNRELSIEISAGYTLTHTIGPCCLPVIPYFSVLSEDNILTLNTIITSKSKPAIIDFLKFKIFINDGKVPQYYVLSRRASLSDEKSYRDKVYISDRSPVKINADSEIGFSLKLKADANKVDTIKIQIEGIEIDGRSVAIPVLFLKKKKGSFNYDEFTL